MRLGTRGMDWAMGFVAFVLLGIVGAAPSLQAQNIDTSWFPQVLSREYSIHVAGIGRLEFTEVASREWSVYVGDESTPPWKQGIAREVSIVVTTPAVPARVSTLMATPVPDGSIVTLSWMGYNEWAQADVVRYDIYQSDKDFGSVSNLTRIASVHGETFTLTITNLAPWQDRFFAVVAVDALDGFDPVVNAAGAYVIAKEVSSREQSVFVGDESSPPFGQLASREFSVVVTTPDWPARVTNLQAIPTPDGGSVTLSWLGYNEWAQRDVKRYDIYMASRGFSSVSNMTRIAWVHGETFSLVLTNLPPWEDRSFAVVPVDALEGFDPVVNAAGAYVIAKEVSSREFAVFTGGETTPPIRQVASRELSIVVPDGQVPSPVTRLGGSLTGRDSADTFSAIDLDWTPYNEVGERDVVRYRVYLGPT